MKLSRSFLPGKETNLLRQWQALLQMPHRVESGQMASFWAFVPPTDYWSSLVLREFVISLEVKLMEYAGHCQRWLVAFTVRYMQGDMGCLASFSPGN